MKRATVYLSKGKLFLHASSRTTDGVWIASEPFSIVDLDVSDADLGQAILSTLRGSQAGVSHPRTWTGLLEPLLTLANVRSWGAFARRASCVEIEEDDSNVSVIPTQNLGANDGFQAEPARAVVIESRSTEELGAVVRRVVR